MTFGRVWWLTLEIREYFLRWVPSFFNDVKCVLYYSVFLLSFEAHQ